MDSYYQDLHKWVQDQQYRFQDRLDKPEHPTAHVIREELHKLRNETEMRKNPRDLEQRMRVIQRQIKEAEHQGHGILTTNDTTTMHHDFEQRRLNIRQWPHY